MTILIKKRFCGPPDSGNGGYSAGMIAANLPFPVEVTLRKPPPLDQPMQLVQNGDFATLMNGETLIAEAKVTDLQLTAPPPIRYETALKAKNTANAYQLSPLPRCFVCGVARAEGDGLRIHAGGIGKQKVATIWKPFTELGNENGVVKTEFIWSALDCPGAWAIQDESNFYLLGRMAAKEILPVHVNEEYIVMGWVIDTEGRKTWTGTAIYNLAGEVCALAKGTWILVKQ